MDVTILIRTKNEVKYIEDTLNLLESQSYEGDYETVVVDSGSTDGTVDLLHKHDVRLLRIPAEEFSYGRSLNIGSEEAKGRFIVNLSAHAQPRDAHWLGNLISGFENSNTAGVYGKQVSIGRLNPFEAYQNELFFGSERKTFNLRNKEALKHVHFSNGNCAVRKDVWKRLKFNEEVDYAEDILWQREVVEAGFSIVYIPDAVVYHTHEVNVRRVFRTARDCAYALAFMNRKGQSISLALYDLGLLFGLIPASFFRNFSYLLNNRHFQHLTIAPLYVMSALLGWFAGRTKHRLKS